MNKGTDAVPSIPELLRELADETATLVRQELELARVELEEKAKPVASSTGLFGGGVLFGLGAFGAATIFLIALIALALPVWAAALIVAAVYGAAAWVMAERARKVLQRVRPDLPQTTTTVKEDIEWAKTRLKSGAK